MIHAKYEVPSTTLTPIKNKTNFDLIIQEIAKHNTSFVSLSKLKNESKTYHRTGFRYDIHVRDIPNTYSFIKEHERRQIPATFFLQIGYSILEKKVEDQYVDLARIIKSTGLDVGFHTSPVDSYFIWANHEGNPRKYAEWLKEHGKEFLTKLSSDKDRLMKLNSEVTDHFKDAVKYARSILGSVKLVSSHGGELGQIMRPVTNELGAETISLVKDLFANHWMSHERLSFVDIEGDVEQFRSPQLMQLTDGGGGGDRLLKHLQTNVNTNNIQILIHPYGWRDESNSKELTKTIIAAKPQTSALPFVEIDLAKPNDSCKSACARVHDKWTAWFVRTFKNTELEIGDLRYSASGLPLAVIELSQTVAEYLKLIGDKSRNMIRKAEKNGYSVRKFQSASYIDDIYAIRVSKEFRSGKPIPDSFRERPQPFDSAGERLCERHQIVAVGVFKEETLVAYVALHNSGEISIINTILGHGAHLKFGVMNLLIFGAFQELKKNFPTVKYLNYLTLRSSTPELDRFKKSVGFVPLNLGIEIASPPKPQPLVAPAIISSQEDANPIANLIERKAFKKILIRGDCCSIRTVARNPEIFGRPQIIQNEKCTSQVYLDHVQGISYPDDTLASLSNLDAMPQSLRRYYLNQNKAEILKESGADLLVFDSYADAFFQVWENKKTKAKLWVNAKYLHNRTEFEKEHTRLPRKTFHEVLLDTIKIIEVIRVNNPNIPVLYLTHPIHYYRFLNMRREFCYLGEELERFVPNVYWGTHLSKEECDPVDMNSCGPGETHHYTPETYAKMVMAAAQRKPKRTIAPATW